MSMFSQVIGCLHEKFHNEDGEPLLSIIRLEKDGNRRKFLYNW